MYQRYQLPNLKVGIGIAYSKAIVTTVGIEGQFHPKAIGECVYRASKLSKGTNEILYDEKIKYLWPKSNGGKIRFSEKRHKNSEHAKGFIVEKSN